MKRKIIECSDLWNGCGLHKLESLLNEYGFVKSFETGALYQYSQDIYGFIVNINLDFFFYADSNDFEGVYYRPDRVSVSCIMCEDYVMEYMSDENELKDSLKEIEHMLNQI